MNSQHTARIADRERRDRIGMAEVVLAYGMESVMRRIEQLRITGMHYAAKAIEHELAVPGAPSHAAEPGQLAGCVDGLRTDGQPHPKLGLGDRFCHPALGETRTQLIGGQWRHHRAGVHLRGDPGIGSQRGHFGEPPLEFRRGTITERQYVRDPARQLLCRLAA